MSQIPLPTYSFGDVFGTLIGPGGAIPFGMGSGSAEEEGIAFEQSENKNKMRVGAGGDVMHALVLDDSGRCMIHVLKTSPINAALTQMFNYQKSSSLFWGKNVITTTNPVTGDQYVCSQVAFTKRPNNSYAKDPNQIVWEFDCGNIFATLGV